MPAAPRFFSTKSGETSALSRLIRELLAWVWVRRSRTAAPARTMGTNRYARSATLQHQWQGVRTRSRPRHSSAASEVAATERGGHAAQVDRAPFGEQGAHSDGGYHRAGPPPTDRPDDGI